MSGSKIPLFWMIRYSKDWAAFTVTYWSSLLFTAIETAWDSESGTPWAVEGGRETVLRCPGWAEMTVGSWPAAGKAQNAPRTAAAARAAQNMANLFIPLLLRHPFYAGWGPNVSRPRRSVTARDVHRDRGASYTRRGASG